MMIEKQKSEEQTRKERQKRGEEWSREGREERRGEKRRDEVGGKRWRRGLESKKDRIGY